MRERLRIWFRRLAVACVLFVVGALALEATLHVIDWRPKGDLLVVDSKVGRRLVAGSDYVAWGARVVIGPNGLRIPALAGKSPGPNVPRVLFLGGSTTFGYGLEWHETFPEQFERVMASRSIEVESVNAGVPLGDSSNRRAYLELHGAAIAPSLIVFAEVINDLSAVGSPHHQCYQDGHLAIHYTHPEEESWPLPDLVPSQPEVETYRTPQYLDMAKAHVSWRVWVNWFPTLRSFLRSNPPFTWMYRHDPGKYQKRMLLDVNQIDHGFELYRSNLRAIAAWGRERDIPVVFISQPRRGHQDFYALLPKDARQKTRRAVELILDGRLAAARPILEAVHNENPDHLTPRYNLGVVLSHLADHEAAKGHVERVLEIRTIAHNMLMNSVADEVACAISQAELAFQIRGGELWLGDGVHPSPDGANVIAETLADTLERSGWPSSTDPQ